MAARVEIRERHGSFGGEVLFCTHESESCAAPMRFSLYLPPGAGETALPVLYWLSGLTCTEENFMVKAGAQSEAARLGLVLVAPDTSPRDTGTPGEDEDWDLGTGAGFYLDADSPPWNRHYRTYSWITRELPALIAGRFPVDPGRTAIAGHSMGGHGALVCALREPGRYRSVSAFAPICAPTRCPWGVKALSAYLGEDRDAWREWDACELIRRAEAPMTLLVDQGAADPFLAEQLRPELLEAACDEAGFKLSLRRRPGYDHSYYFVASFIREHLQWHARRLLSAD